MKTKPETAFIRDGEGAFTTLHVIGDIDLTNAAKFKESILALTKANRSLIDLTKCTYIDSSGIDVLSRTSEFVDFQVAISTGSPFRKLFHLCALSHLLESETP